MTPYVVTRSAWNRSWLLAVFLLVVLAVDALVLRKVLSVVLLALLFAALWVVQVRADAVLLRADRRGVQLGAEGAGRNRLRVPWSSISELVVDAPAAAAVAVRLKAGVPLPRGMSTARPGWRADPAPEVGTFDRRLVRAVPDLQLARLQEVATGAGVPVVQDPSLISVV